MGVEEANGNKIKGTDYSGLEESTCQKGKLGDLNVAEMTTPEFKRYYNGYPHLTNGYQFLLWLSQQVMRQMEVVQVYLIRHPVSLSI